MGVYLVCWEKDEVVWWVGDHITFGGGFLGRGCGVTETVQPDTQYTEVTEGVAKQVTVFATLLEKNKWMNK